MVPLLAIFTIFWNISQFPSFHIDEGHYIRKALYLLKGYGLQEDLERYSHPFMGHIVLGAFLMLVGFPNAFNPNASIGSIIAMYTVPRVFMGMHDSLDTFLVFAVARYSYNTNVAFVASVLFAISPMSWQLRRVVLDTIQLPFLLMSILLILVVSKKILCKNYSNCRSILIVLSGVFLGLAIFTKVPAITVIPIILFILWKSSVKENKRRNQILKKMVLWCLPVILIPAIWPLYAIWSNDFDRWTGDVLLQASQRSRSPLLFESFFSIDPLLLILGVGGFVFTLVRKDMFVTLWAMPFIVLAPAHGWFLSFHWNLLFPVFCISAGVLLVEFPKVVFSLKIARKIQISSVTIVFVFCFVSTLIVTSLNLAQTQFEAASASASYLKTATNGSKDTNYLIVASPIFEWLFKYPLEFNNTFNYRVAGINDSSKALLILDKSFRDFLDTDYRRHFSLMDILNDNNTKTRIVNGKNGSWIEIELGNEEKVCQIEISWFKGESRVYDFAVLMSNNSPHYSNPTNYHSNGKTSSEKYIINGSSGKYIKVNFFGNSENNISSISEIDLYGYHKLDSSGERICSSRMNPNNITTSNGFETNQGKRFKQLEDIIKNTYFLFDLKSKENVNTEIYPYTSLKYADPGYIEVRTK